jgi:hypothetical protein
MTAPHHTPTPAIHRSCRHEIIVINLSSDLLKLGGGSGHGGKPEGVPVSDSGRVAQSSGFPSSGLSANCSPRSKPARGMGSESLPYRVAKPCTAQRQLGGGTSRSLPDCPSLAHRPRRPFPEGKLFPSPGHRNDNGSLNGFAGTPTRLLHATPDVRPATRRPLDECWTWESNTVPVETIGVLA